MDVSFWPVLQKTRIPLVFFFGFGSIVCWRGVFENIRFLGESLFRELSAFKFSTIFFEF